MGNIKHTGFQLLLHQIFIHEKKYPVDSIEGSIARMAGLEPATFYSYSGGINYFPPDLIPNLYNATVLYDIQHKRKPVGEMRLWTFLLQDTGLEAVAIDRANDADSMEQDLLDVSELKGQMVTAYKKMVTDGRISDRENEEWSNLISEMQRELENLRAKARPGRKKKWAK